MDMPTRRLIGWSVAAFFGIAGVLFFFQTRDPMILIFAIIAAAIALAVAGAGTRSIDPGRPACPACGAGNLAGSKFCSQCGRGM